MQQMVDELTQDTLDAKFMWKEGEIMAGGDLVDEKGNIKDNTDPTTHFIFTRIADKNDPPNPTAKSYPTKLRSYF